MATGFHALAREPSVCIPSKKNMYVATCVFDTSLSFYGTIYVVDYQEFHVSVVWVGMYRVTFFVHCVWCIELFLWESIHADGHEVASVNNLIKGRHFQGFWSQETSCEGIAVFSMRCCNSRPTSWYSEVRVVALCGSDTVRGIIICSLLWLWFGPLVSFPLSRCVLTPPYDASSSRELATVIWVFVALVGVSRRPDIRHHGRPGY